MTIVEKDYDEAFIKQCRKEFGMKPAEVKKILTTLCVHGRLDVDSLFNELDALRGGQK